MLVEQSIKSNSEFKHSIISLEYNKKRDNVDNIKKYCTTVEVPTIEEFNKLIEDIDIVQLEWWNNRTIIKYLSSINTPIRLITCCHNNGIYQDNIKDSGKLPATIPKQLILASDIFTFTSECSFDAKVVKNVLKEHPEYYDKLWCVNSCGEYDDLPGPESKDSFTKFSSNDISVGYFGTINFAKLHPQYIDFLKEIDIHRFKIKMIGECSDVIRDQLNKQCEALGKPGILEFTGYVSESKLVSELSSINVLAYILNPRHYDTSELTLLESMSMGTVPIVLNNPAEKCIVKNRETGLIVKSPKEFGEAIKLLRDPDYRQKLGINASLQQTQNK